MTPSRILTIEDDAAIRRGIVDALRGSGYQVSESGRADEGERLALGQDYDLLLLDLVLPGGSGFDILKTVRAERPTQPVIVLTARGDEDDRVRGLQLGADDYVVKPFSVRELLARVAAVLRRAPERLHRAGSIEVIGLGMIDFARREVRYAGGGRCDLSDREVALVRYLSVHQDRSVSRDELLANVWGIDARGVSTRTIDMHVARLREKLRDDPADARIVLTVRGQGYMFCAGAGIEP